MFVRDGVIITSHEFYGRTALHLAAFDGDLVTMQTLLDAGADPKAVDQSGCTPLHFAAQRQVAGAIPILIAAGAEVDARDRQGSTSLLHALSAFNGNGETIRALVNAKADPDIRNDRADSPRQLAARIADRRVAQFL